MLQLIASRRALRPEATRTPLGVLWVALALALVCFSGVQAEAQRKTPPDAAASSQVPGKPAETGDAAAKADAATKPDAGGSKSEAGAKPGGGGQGGGGRRRGGGAAAEGDAAKPDKTAYDYYLPGADGKDIPLAEYKDKYLLVVNLGRKSSYSEQLPALVKLNDTYKSKGLVVIGVPSNEFGAAEPGTNAEIQKAYADAKVDFPVMSVSKLTGDDALPFYQYLTTGKGAPAGGAVAWNYTKFIIDKKGAVVARIDPDVTPDSPEMMATIDQILDGTYKPKRAAGGGRGAAAAGAGPD